MRSFTAVVERCPEATQAFVWWVADSRRLSELARDAILTGYPRTAAARKAR